MPGEPAVIDARVYTGVHEPVRPIESLVGCVAVEPPMVERLCSPRFQMENTSVRNAEALPLEAFDELNATLDRCASIVRAGPVVSLQRQLGESDGPFQVDNFFLSPLADRAHGPNALMVALDPPGLRVEIVLCSVQELARLMEAGRALDFARRMQEERAALAESDIPASATRCILALKQHEAALVPVNLMPWRLLDDGSALVVRGYFGLRPR